jgi:hypothetical protein
MSPRRMAGAWTASRCFSCRRIGGEAADEYTLYHPAEIELADLTKRVVQHVQTIRPTPVVFDALSEFRLLARDPLRHRRQILGLKDFFPQKPSTVLLLDDHSGGTGRSAAAEPGARSRIPRTPSVRVRTARRRLRIGKTVSHDSPLWNVRRFATLVRSAYSSRMGLHRHGEYSLGSA